jgi:hypothetical protein
MDVSGSFTSPPPLGHSSPAAEYAAMGARKRGQSKKKKKKEKKEKKKKKEEKRENAPSISSSRVRRGSR